MSPPHTCPHTEQHSHHPPFKLVEASRPPWDTEAAFHYTRTIEPDWAPPAGANSHAGDDKPHVAIDPVAQSGMQNYKFLIGAVTPRPIALISTRAADGTGENIAPFSFFNVVAADPPTFSVGFSCTLAAPKDTLRNLLETKECVINIISERIVEAANACAVNAPYGASEWNVSGLTKVYDCKTVKAARVKESVVSIEAKLESHHQLMSKITGTESSVVTLIEGTQFWVREDALSEDKSMVEIEVLKPISRLGGITYGRTVEAIEILRLDWERDLHGKEGFEKLKQPS